MIPVRGLREAEGPYFDDLRLGDVYEPGRFGPAALLTEGLTAAYRVIVGDRLALPPATPDSAAVGATVAHPALVWDLAIGQSAAVTRREVGNASYRGLVFHRMPALGDTLATRTEIVGLRPDRSSPTGLVTLRMTTSDQHDRAVLEFWRFAILPVSEPGMQTVHDDEDSAVSISVSSTDGAAAVAGWDLSWVLTTGPLPRPRETGRSGFADLVSSAELARRTLNLAGVHHDSRVDGGRRVVHGGHAVGLALAQATRAVPGLVTVTAWESCDHTGPVHEGDTIASEVVIEDVRARVGGGSFLRLRSAMSATAGPHDQPRSVLDWRFTALVA